MVRIGQISLLNICQFLDLLEQERQKKEAEEKRRAEAEAAYQQWVKTKKNVKLRRLTPSPPPERDLKWYFCFLFDQCLLKSQIYRHSQNSLCVELLYKYELNALK